MDFPLGLEWYDAFYDELQTRLGYSHKRDLESRDELSRLLKIKNPIQLFDEKLRYRFEKKVVFLCGAGPSLTEDIKNLYPLMRKAQYPVIAADGAADALTQAKIFPPVIVSDLDSASEEMLITQSEERALFVHAHGDNILLLKKLVPKLGRRLSGTTQVESTTNVVNVGGLTDGDRSCFLVSVFSPQAIVLAGMDFGKVEGEYSKARHNSGNVFPKNQRHLKLNIGRRSLEFLIKRKPKIRFLNVTAFGGEITGAKKISHEELIRELS